MAEMSLNLLAWRSQKARYERNTLRLFIFAGVLFAILFLWGAHYCLAQILDDQADRVNELSEKLADVPRENKEPDTSVALQKFISPAHLKKMLFALSASTEVGVCYQKITRDSARVMLAGMASSVLSAPLALHALQDNEIFADLKLREINRQEGGDTQHFLFEIGDVPNASV